VTRPKVRRINGGRAIIVRYGNGWAVEYEQRRGRIETVSIGGKPFLMGPVSLYGVTWTKTLRAARRVAHAHLQPRP
jgi:hypothetical protein